MTAPVPHDPPEVHDELWSGWSGEVGWDVGANVGQSLPDMVQRFTVVHAFEPSEEAWPTLQATRRRFGRAVKAHQIAVGEFPGLLTVAVRSAPMASGQLVAVGMPYHGEDHGPGTANWGIDEGTRDVWCEPADVLAREFGSPDFVKVDTEGHEALVLSGARSLLAAKRCGWLIEFHTADRGARCEHILTRAGYQPEIIRHPAYEPGSGMWYAHGWIRAPRP